MNAKYFFSLFWRNIKGIFVSGFKLSATEVTFPLAIIHIALLPITLTFGAGIKTLFDCFTRIYTPEETLTSVKQSILKMDDDQTAKLAKTLLQHAEPASDSSKIIFNSLSKPSEELKSKINFLYMNKQKALIQQQIESNPESLLTVPNKNYFKVQLNAENSAKLKQYYDETLKPLIEESKSKELPSIKNNISNYINDKKNNGKKMFQLTVNFFNSKVEQNENATLTASNSLNFNK